MNGRVLLQALALLTFSLLLPSAAYARLPRPDEIVEIESESLDHPLQPGQTSVLEVRAKIADGWHINSDKPLNPAYIPTDLAIQAPAGVIAANVSYPAAQQKILGFSGGELLSVFTGDLTLKSALKAQPEFKKDEGQKLTAVLNYQACNDSQCLEPVSINKEIDLKQVAIRAPERAPVVAEIKPTAENEASTLFQHHSYPLGFLLVFLAGIALNLTPCVYPLIGVTVAYFGNQSDGDFRKTGILASIYVAGIALTFAAVGVAVALSGGLFGAALSSPYVLILIAMMMLGLAASSFGYFSIAAPQWMVQRAGIARPGYAGSLLMGLGMGVIAAPCIGPIVLGLLALVEQSRSAAFGFALFFTLALGLGVPYIALALMAGSVRNLPRSGEWLTWIEHLFGFVLVGLALYFLDPLTPNRLITRILPFYAVAVGIYLGFFSREGAGLAPFRRFKIVLGMASVVALVYLLIPRHVPPPMAFDPYEEHRFQKAHEERKPVLIDFSADWCIPCREMEHTTFADPGVVKEAQRFVRLRADLTRKDGASESLISEFRVQGVPTYLIFDSGGKERKKLVGFISPDEFLNSLRNID